MTAIRIDGQGVRPDTPKPLPTGMRDSAATQLRRLIVQALASPDWPREALARAGRLVMQAQAPGGAEGARLTLARALDGRGNVRLNLVGALAIPGWREADLIALGALLLAAAPASDAAEIEALRAALRGAPA
jgi:hypothetical protein